MRDQCIVPSEIWTFLCYSIYESRLKDQHAFHLIIVGEEGIKFFHCEPDALRVRKRERESSENCWKLQDISREP